MYFGACRIKTPVPMVETTPFQHLLGFQVVTYKVMYILAINGSKDEGWGAAHVVGNQVCVFVSSYALMARDPEDCNFYILSFVSNVWWGRDTRGYLLLAEKRGCLCRQQISPCDLLQSGRLII